MNELDKLKEEYKVITEQVKAITERYSQRMKNNKGAFDAIFAKIWEIEPREENAQNPFASTN